MLEEKKEKALGSDNQDPKVLVGKPDSDNINLGGDRQEVKNRFFEVKDGIRPDFLVLKHKNYLILQDTITKWNISIGIN